MSLTYDDIKSMVQANKTAEQIADILNDRTEHKRNIKATGGNAAANDPDLLHVLASRFKVLRVSTGATWKGPLADYIDSLQDTNPIKVGLEELISNLQVTGRYVYCTDPDVGALTTAVTLIVTQIIESGSGNQAYNPNAGNDSEGNPIFKGVTVQEEMDSLTGGKKYNVTAQQVQDLIDKQAKLDLIATAKAVHNAERNKCATAEQRCELLAGGVDSLTEQQVTAEIAKIATYPDSYTPPGGA